VFWYADPTICKCLFEGDELAYDRFGEELKRQNDTAAYANYGRSPEEVADLSPFGDAFPPPVLGWPMVIYVGGPISSAGGNYRGGSGAVSSAGGYGVGYGISALGSGRGGGGPVGRR
jgi:hypothetical protein